MRRTMTLVVLTVSLAAATVLCSTSAVADGSGICVAFGGNSAGQLGNGALSDLTAVAAGSSHSLAVRSNGTVWAFGLNTHGQLGNGSNTDSGTPVQVKDPSDPTGNLTGVIAVAAGESHSLALKGDGTVRAWGLNDKGQLGNGTNDNSNRAVQVGDPTDLLTGVTHLAAGAKHSLAVRSDGRVWAWGWGESYQLGEYATGHNRNLPVQAFELSNAVAVAGGDENSLALRNDGQVYRWGKRCDFVFEIYPNLGLGLTDVQAIASGAGHGLAVKNDGSLWAWGYNTHGQLGDGGTGDRASAAQVPEIAGASLVAGGGAHSVVALEDGTVRTFGLNASGQLGDGTTADRHSPVTAFGVSGVTSVAGGGTHTLCVASENPVPVVTGLDPAT